jgi:hypothetical protein
VEEVAEKVREMQIPRRPLGFARGRLSPRKRGCGRLGMTKLNDVAVRLKPHPFKTGTEMSFSATCEGVA